MPHPRHAGNERPIDLARRTRAEGLRERRGGKPRLCHEQATGCVLVEPMHEARSFAVAAAYRLEHAAHVARGAGAALHRKPHRLVDYEHVVIFVECDAFEEMARLLGLARWSARPRRRLEREW